MEQIKRIELKLADWYESAPRLPLRGRKWLAENVWWIDLIGVILSGISILAVVSALFLATGILTIVGGVVGATIGGILLVAALVNLAFAIVEIVLLAMAIGPLKNGLKRGWNYLFVVFLLSILSALVSFLFHLSAGGLVALFWNAVFLAIWGYFLFEIRRYLVNAKGKSRA